MKIKEVNQKETAEIKDISVNTNDTSKEKKVLKNARNEEQPVFTLNNTGPNRFAMDHAFLLFDFCS